MLSLAILGISSLASMQIKSPWSEVELVNRTVHACSYSNVLEKCAFLAVIWADSLRGLCNFWAQQLSASYTCVNPRLNRLLMGKIAQILLGGLAGKIVKSCCPAGWQRELHNTRKERLVSL